MRKVNVVRQTFIYALLLALCALVTVPFVWMVTGSLKTSAQIGGEGISLLPPSPASGGTTPAHGMRRSD